MRQYLCKSGLHKHNSEEKADSCAMCRRMLDAGVRRYFKRISDRMLAA